MFRPPIPGAAVTEVTKTTDDPFASIEQTQAALRDSIEKAKALALESERRIRPRCEEAPRAEPPNPA
jgi:hypothetical protein